MCKSPDKLLGGVFAPMIRVVEGAMRNHHRVLCLCLRQSKSRINISSSDTLVMLETHTQRN